MLLFIRSIVTRKRLAIAVSSSTTLYLLGLLVSLCTVIKIVILMCAVTRVYHLSSSGWFPSGLTVLTDKCLLSVLTNVTNLKQNGCMERRLLSIVTNSELTIVSV